MRHKACGRLWQVEAARDGRLAGADLANARRHEQECAECKQAAGALGQLGQRLKALPVQPTPPLVQRRTRQALLGAWNEHLLAEPRSKARTGALAIAALCALSGVALAIGYPRLHALHRSPEAAIVQRKAELSVGSRRNQPAPAEPHLATATVTQPPAPSLTAKPRTTAALVKSRTAAEKVEPSSTSTVTNSAEDEAYLQIVELLRNGRESEARAKATQYLLRFPHGFRRLEIENITEH